MSTRPTHYADGPRLLADIGGTNARFALEASPGRIEHIQTLSCADYPRFEDAARTYLKARQRSDVRHAVIAIANPVGPDLVKMTNHDWEFSIVAARLELGLSTLLVVHDFAALAGAIPTLSASEMEKIGAGQAIEGAVIGVVGAGTGLGVAGLVPTDGRWMTLESEGGHVAFSPADARELAILTYCWQRHSHVSAERLVSGPGIVLIYQALGEWNGVKDFPALSTSAIVNRALAGEDALCVETLDVFCGMLGTVAANVAVTLCARGGIYIGGGVVPRLGNYFARSAFRERFESKGRFSSFTAQIPTLLITAAYPALQGAAAMLYQHLNDPHTRPAALLAGNAGSTTLLASFHS
jgi:glucokinase